MSVLLLGLSEDLASVLAERLLGQQDEVRTVVATTDAAERWKRRSVHAAVGPFDDADLVERAALNVRTAVVGEHLEPPTTETTVALADGLGAAGVERVVVVGAKVDEWLVHDLKEGRAQYVILRLPRRSRLGRPRLPVGSVAEAIDAADDLAGEVRLDLDLADPHAWATLGVPAPQGA